MQGHIISGHPVNHPSTSLHLPEACTTPDSIKSLLNNLQNTELPGSGTIMYKLCKLLGRYVVKSNKPVILYKNNELLQGYKFVEGVFYYDKNKLIHGYGIVNYRKGNTFYTYEGSLKYGKRSGSQSFFTQSTFINNQQCTREQFGKFKDDKFVSGQTNVDNVVFDSDESMLAAKNRLAIDLELAPPAKT